MKNQPLVNELLSVIAGTLKINTIVIFERKK